MLILARMSEYVTVMPRLCHVHCMQAHHPSAAETAWPAPVASGGAAELGASGRRFATLWSD